MLQTLKDCRDVGDARVLLAEAHLMLTNSRLSDRIQELFWEGLHYDLVVAQESAALLGVQTKAELNAVLTAAQIEVAHYLGAARS